QVPHDGVAQIALRARDTAESRYQAQSQFGKTEARRFIRDDQVAEQRQFEPAAESHAVNRRDGGQGRGVNRVRNPMDAVEEIADHRSGLVEAHLLRAEIKLAQVGARAKASFHSTVNDQRARFVFQRLVSLDEFLQLFQRSRADLIAWLSVQ